jgi:hypothetical protein
MCVRGLSYLLKSAKSTSVTRAMFGLYYLDLITLGGLVVMVLAIGPKVLGFKSGRRRRIFKGDTSQQHDFL